MEHFSVSYDLARQAEIQAEISKKWMVNMADQDPSAHDVAKTLQKPYTSMLDRSRIDMRFTAEGLVIDSRMTFK